MTKRERGELFLGTCLPGIRLGKLDKKLEEKVKTFSKLGMASTDFLDSPGKVSFHSQIILEIR